MFASVNLMATRDSDEYGRCGLLYAGMEDETLQEVIPLFQEALGSAVPVMVPPSGVYLMELPTTFISTCSSRFRSPAIMGRVSSYWHTRVWPRRWHSSSTARHTEPMGR